MLEVLTTTAAMTLAKLALDKFVESGASELGKTLTDEASKKVMALGNAIWERLKDNEAVVESLEASEKGDAEAPAKLAPYLNYLCDQDADFTKELKKLADALHFELIQIADNSSMTQNNFGNAKGWQTKVAGGTAYIGEVHIHGQDEK